MQDDNQNSEHSSNLPAKRTDGAVPKPYRVHHDGWTAERKTAFIDALARTGCIRDACRVSGISSTSAYRYRRRGKAGRDLIRHDEAITEKAYQGASSRCSFTSAAFFIWHTRDAPMFRV
ncbi:hypothetical protein AB1K62_11420 [Parasphingorhabdus sp. JC815]|uniref:hypothetical protein n=1 Tax=Parasphingorhabdus sp. JC815 TaxID=3232140 RepID=UPI0034586F45